MAELPVPLPSRAMIGGWNTDQYIHVLRLPIIVVTVVILAAVLTGLSQTLVIILEALSAVWMGWLVQRSHGRRVESLTAGALSGLGMGLAASLARFMLAPSAGTIFGGVSETLLTAIVISLLTVSANILLSLFANKKTN